MPDLYLVMSEAELEEAVGYAKQLGAVSSKTITAINCDIEIQGKSLQEMCENSNYWFPKFVNYTLLPTSEDMIAILLSPTIWNTYDDSKLFDQLRKNDISIDTEYDPLFIQPRELINWILEEKKVSQEMPINSPWTARDYEVVETALETIDGIFSATLLRQADLHLKLYVNKVDDNLDYFVVLRDVAKKDIVADFSYPNILHLKPNEGNYNVFMGEDISLEGVMGLLKKAKIPVTVKDFDEQDVMCILYEDRKKTISRKR